GDAGERPAGADSDVARNRFTQRRHRRRPCVLRTRQVGRPDRLTRLVDVIDDSTPWAMGLTVAAFVAAVTATAVVVLSLGLTRVHPLLAVGLNLVAVGGLAPTVW